MINWSSNVFYSKILWRNIHMKIMSCMSNFSLFVTRAIDMNHLSARVAFSEVKLLNIVRNSSRSMIYGLPLACCLRTKAIQGKLIMLAYITINLHHTSYVCIFFSLYLQGNWTEKENGIFFCRINSFLFGQSIWFYYIRVSANFLIKRQFWLVHEWVLLQ